VLDADQYLSEMAEEPRRSRAGQAPADEAEPSLAQLLHLSQTRAVRVWCTLHQQGYLPGQLLVLPRPQFPHLNSYLYNTRGLTTAPWGCSPPVAP
jgi:hypothetical protein